MTLNMKMRHYGCLLEDGYTNFVVDVESDSLENAHCKSTKTNDTTSKVKTLTQSMELYDE